MCGISACIAISPSLANGQKASELRHDGIDVDNTDSAGIGNISTRMKQSINLLNHRGPDENGVWVSDDARVALGHCRLSINDLSPRGAQPLTSADGNIRAVVNGEIYDFDRLRKICIEDHGYVFSSESDSELVVALYVIHGAPGLFEHLRGEFAFVLYDGRPDKQRVIAVRDRFGIKPLVWTRRGDELLIASEAKAFLALGWEPQWDVKAIVTSGWQFDDRTLFKDVKKLLPGHWMDITDQGVDIHQYWDSDYEDKRKVETRSIEEMVAGVREKLVEAVELRLRADVPVGIYLSGGIDSSALAGIVTKLARERNVKIGSTSTTQVACFSVEFPSSSGFDESSIAERTAKFLGVDLIKRQVNEKTLARDFSEAVYHCEHHHFDLNFVAKYALSSLPQERGFKVVLTGEGADEHFAGYPYFPVEFLREPDTSKPESPLARQPETRSDLFRHVELDMKRIWESLGATAEEPSTKCCKVALAPEVKNTTMPRTLLVWHASRLLFTSWVQQQTMELDFRNTLLEAYSPSARAKMASRWHPLHSALYMWNKTTLANVLLSCLGDRTEMAHSIEARTPFLDHHLAEYVNRLPPSVKVGYANRNGDGESHSDQGPLWKKATPGLSSFTEKWILREAVRPFITDELYERKKHPFLAPMKWPESGPLHSMLAGLLTREAVEELGFVDYGPVKASLGRAFGEKGDATAFRNLLYVAGWVTLGQRFNVKRAEMSEWVD